MWRVNDVACWKVISAMRNRARKGKRGHSNLGGRPWILRDGVPIIWEKTSFQYIHCQKIFCYWGYQTCPKVEEEWKKQSTPAVNSWPICFHLYSHPLAPPGNLKQILEITVHSNTLYLNFFYLLIFVVQCDAQGILIPWPEFKLAPLQWKVDS